MATHSSILAWRIPRTEESGGLQSIASLRYMSVFPHYLLLKLFLYYFSINLTGSTEKLKAFNALSQLFSLIQV